MSYSVWVYLTDEEMAEAIEEGRRRDSYADENQIEHWHDVAHNPQDRIISCIGERAVAMYFGLKWAKGGFYGSDMVEGVEVRTRRAGERPWSVGEDMGYGDVDYKKQDSPFVLVHLFKDRINEPCIKGWLFGRDVVARKYRGGGAVKHFVPPGDFNDPRELYDRVKSGRILYDGDREGPPSATSRAVVKTQPQETKTMQLRPYQELSIQKLREAAIARENAVLMLPTGAGKTAIASSIFTMARERGKRVAFCVPFLSLINQTWSAFKRAGLSEREMGVIQADNPLTNWAMPIQICSVETLVRRPKLPQVDLVVFDEAHRQSKLYERWMKAAPEARFIGLSATPWARGMAAIWDRLIVPTSVSELIRDGYLSKFRYYAPSSPDLSGVKVRAGDYVESELSEAMNKPRLVADIVTTWLEKAERRRTFVFAVDCAHAKAIQQQFIEAGVKAEYIDAYTEVEDRDRMIDQLARKEIDMITSVGCLTTGVDCPSVDCLILARPTRSEMLYMQIVGRGLRTCEGKTDCLILDHSDTGLTLGLPDEIHYEQFTADNPDARAAPAERKEPLPKKCGACGYLKPAKVHQCPACGFEPAAQPNVAHADGELEEVRGGGRGKKEKATKDDKQLFWSELMWIVQYRGYKRGWASNKYREKFDVWPLELRDDPAYPRQSTFSWIKSRNIAWAKSRGNRQAAAG